MLFMPFGSIVLLLQVTPHFHKDILVGGILSGEPHAMFLIRILYRTNKFGLERNLPLTFLQINY